MRDLIKAAGSRLLTKAVDDATEAVEKTTTLRGASARKVATVALKAGGDSLRAEYTLRLGDPREAVAAAALSIAILACDVVLMTAVAVKGPRRLRAVAGATLAGHIILVAVAQRRRFLTAGKANAVMDAPQ